MSAFMCSNYHISVLASYAQNMCRYAIDGVIIPVEVIGDNLFRENERSVNHRYRENHKGVYRFIVPRRNYSHIEIIKLAHCLDYQSCETHNWEDTEAYRILQIIIESAIYNLPGYEEAKWRLSDPEKECKRT